MIDCFFSFLSCQFLAEIGVSSLPMSLRINLLLCLDGDFEVSCRGVYDMSNVLSAMISFAVLGLQFVEQDGMEQSIPIPFENIREILLEKFVSIS